MKGIIFNLAEEVVTASYGEEAWDALLEATGLDGAYTAVGSYPDQQLLDLIAAASAALERPPEQITSDIGRDAIPLMAQRYPEFFQGHRNAQSFVLTVNEVIHTEVAKLYPEADVPTFGLERTADDVLALVYRSPRQLCALAVGFVTGAARFYGQRVEITQPSCMHRGDDHCLIRCTFSSAAPPGDGG